MGDRQEADSPGKRGLDWRSMLPVFVVVSLDAMSAAAVLATGIPMLALAMLLIVLRPATRFAECTCVVPSNAGTAIAVLVASGKSLAA